MVTKLAKILDECIARVNEGESIKACLAQYSHVKEEVEPLLYTALNVAKAPKVVPSDEFIKALEERLIARHIESQVSQEAPTVRRLWPSWLSLEWQSLSATIIKAKRVAIPAAIGLLIVIVASFGTLHLISPSPALASQCTLSILGGGTEIRKSSADNWQKGTDGMILNAGTRIKTSPDSRALLTFFEGSTIKLEPNTDIEIQQVKVGEQQATSIVLKQWLGKTWSRVIKMADSGSHYKIETPLAIAAVRGTLFTTEVDETGFTKIATTEGLVSVMANGEEVLLPPNQQTQVETGATPSIPIELPSPTSEIVINIDRPAIGSVIDPSRASTGYLPSGLSFNQITGSQSSSLPSGTQIITITEPENGEYIVVLRYLSEGTAHFSIQGKSEGKVAFEYAGNYQGVGESGWLIHIDVDVDNGLIAGSRVVDIEPLTDDPLEKIVETNLAGRGQGQGQKKN